MMRGTRLSNYTPEDVAKILEVFVRGFVVDIPAKHIDGDYLIPLGELEYALSAPSYDWLVDIASTANGEQ